MSVSLTFTVAVKTSLRHVGAEGASPYGRLVVSPEMASPRARGKGSDAILIDALTASCTAPSSSRPFDGETGGDATWNEVGG